MCKENKQSQLNRSIVHTRYLVFDFDVLTKHNRLEKKVGRTNETQDR